MTEERLTLPLPHEGRIVVYADSDEEAPRVVNARLAQVTTRYAALIAR